MNMTEANTSSDLSFRDFDLDSGEEDSINEQKKGRKNEEMKSDHLENSVSMKQVLGRELKNKGTKEKDMTKEAAEKDGKEKLLSEVTIEDEDVAKYVAVYYSDPKLQYYWGRITHVFSNDPETKNDQVKVDFLKKRTYTTDPEDWEWEDKKKQSKDISKARK